MARTVLQYGGTSGSVSPPSSTTGTFNRFLARQPILAGDRVWLGPLSVMDVLLNTRMKEVLTEIPVDDEIRKALLGQSSRYRPVFEVVLDYESGTWEQLTQSSHRIGLHEEYLPDLYLQSVPWVADVLTEVPVLV